MGDAAETLGDRLKTLREGAHESQEQVAHVIGVNSGTYSRWERGTAKPHADQIVKLARHFKCTTDYLLIGGALTEQSMSLELHRFLATKWGRYAKKRKWVGMLREMRVTPEGDAPTVKSYTRMVRAFALSGDEEDFVDPDDEDPSKQTH